MLDELNTLASDVMKYGFSWVEDGPAILKMIELAVRDEEELNDSWDTMTTTERRDTILGRILKLAALYKWDAKNMGPATEKAFLKWMVGVKVF